jgi:hypothetical protein
MNNNNTVYVVWETFENETEIIKSIQTWSHTFVIQCVQSMVLSNKSKMVNNICKWNALFFVYFWITLRHCI